jgi:hypothetical protein
LSAARRARVFLPTSSQAVYVLRPGKWEATGRTDQWQRLESDPGSKFSTEELGFGPANRRVVDDWLDAIAKNREPVCSGRNAMKAIELIMAVYQAALSGLPSRVAVEGSAASIGCVETAAGSICRSRTGLNFTCRLDSDKRAAWKSKLPSTSCIRDRSSESHGSVLSRIAMCSCGSSATAWSVGEKRLRPILRGTRGRRGEVSSGPGGMVETSADPDCGGH